MRHSPLLLCLLILALAGVVACGPAAAPTQASPPPVSAPAPKPVHAAPPLSAVRFVSAQEGWAAGQGAILHSADGGKTWTQQYSSDATIAALAFADATHGWAVAQDRLLRTTDGGQSWQAAGEPKDSALAGVEFTSASQGWGVASGTLYQSGDGGNTWSKVTTQGRVDSTCFADASNGWAAGGSWVLRTTDAGHTWKPTWRAPVEGEEWHATIHCNSASTAWVLLQGSAMMSQQSYVAFRSTDGGAHWGALARESYFSSAYPSVTVEAQIDAYAGPFATTDPATAYFLGSCPACDMSVSLTTTTDGGKTLRYDKIAALAGSMGTALTFADARHGWLVSGKGDQGLILATADGGQTWQQVLPAPAQ